MDLLLLFVLWQRNGMLASSTSHSNPFFSRSGAQHITHLGQANSIFLVPGDDEEIFAAGDDGDDEYCLLLCLLILV